MQLVNSIEICSFGSWKSQESYWKATLVNRVTSVFRNIRLKLDGVAVVGTLRHSRVLKRY